jgi:hypothetical protein
MTPTVSIAWAAAACQQTTAGNHKFEAPNLKQSQMFQTDRLLHHGATHFDDFEPWDLFRIWILRFGI